MGISDEERTVSFDGVEVKAATDKALLCEIDGSEHWIPRSQIIEDGTEVADRGDTGTLVVTRWIATEKGLV